MVAASAGVAGPGGAGAAERPRQARMAFPARGSRTVAMTRRRPSQRGQARTSRAKTRRINAAQVQARVGTAAPGLAPSACAFGPGARRP